MRVHDDFGRVQTGIDLTRAQFDGAAIASPGFAVGPGGEIRSDALATGAATYACVGRTGG